MIDSFSNYKFNENIIVNNDIKSVSILFMDIVKSSEKWKKDEIKMIDCLDKISSFLDKNVNNYDGLIIKSIGDAYMIKFNNLKNSIEFAINIQNKLKEKPIKFNNDIISFRIGICSGNVYEIEQDIQNYKLIDYLGNTVNTAARIESKVCDNGNIAFASLNKNDIELSKTLKDYNVNLISFNNTGDESKRSYRLLTDIQKHTFKNIKELKGIDNVDVYKIIL